MKKLVLLTIAIPLFIFAQEGWVRFYGEDWTDQARCIQQTSDGHYIVIGTDNNGCVDHGNVWFLKLDSIGDTVWTRMYGDGSGYYCIETKDGDYVISGKYSYHYIQLFKINSDGNEIWRYTKEHYSQELHCVQETNDGGYVVGGQARFKTDEDGNVLWLHKAGPHFFIQQTNDGGYILCGLLSGGYAFLYKTNEIGEIVWSNYWGENGTPCSQAWCVRQTDDEGYILTGYTASENDLWLLKTNPDGDTTWTSTYGGAELDFGRSLVITPDNGYVIAGHTYSYGSGGADFWLIKTDSEGNVQWDRTYGGLDDDVCVCVQQTDDGGFVLAGETRSFGKGTADYLLIKTDSLGLIPVVNVSPVKIITPVESGDILNMIPECQFTNMCTENPFGFYYHCEIQDLSDSTYLYHDSILVSNPFEPWETRNVSFAEWTAPQVSDFQTIFYTTDAGSNKQMSVSFRWTGIEEQPTTHQPSFEVITAVGPNIVLQFTDASGSQGDCVAIFDAAGRQVDELHVPQTGTISWGDGQPTGVYFIKHLEGRGKVHKVVLIR